MKQSDQIIFPLAIFVALFLLLTEVASCSPS